MRHVVLALSCGLALTTLGCGDPLKFAQTLEETRNIGVSVSNEEGEASIFAGEDGEISLLFAGPSGTKRMALSYRLCPAADSARGVPFCAEEPWQEDSIEWDGSPIAFTAPDNVESGTRLAFLGAACKSGEPELADEALDWSCSDDSEPLRLSFDAWTGGKTFQNKNPDLSELKMDAGGDRLALEDAKVKASCDDGIVRLKAEKTHEFKFNLGEDVREEIEGDGDAKELLQLSHFSTKGQFERQFTILDADEEPKTKLEWDAPKEHGPVKVYLVVRDGRGGVTWESTSVCVH